MARSFDVIVLGAGSMGSAAAYHLSKAGQRVLLLEQFELNHKRGSSYGVSRVIRYSYDHPTYIEWMRSAYPLWFALEDEVGESLYVKTGGLEFAFPEQSSFQALKQSMDSAGLPYDQLTADEVRDRFPQFCLDDGMVALYQEATGWLKASRCVLAHIRLAQMYGATVLDHVPVMNILPHATSVEVQTATDTFIADRLIITAGSWAKSLLAQHGINLPLKIMPCQVAFYRPEELINFECGTFPIFMAHLSGEYGESPYGIPHDIPQTIPKSIPQQVSNSILRDIPHSDTVIGVKVTTFSGWQTVDHPSEVDYTPSLEWVDRLRSFLQHYIPGLANGTLISTRRCLYTLTPDNHFVIDRHPHFPHLVFAAGFSGHGFKFAPLIGKILMELALEGKTSHDTTLFTLSRFHQAVV